MNSNEREQIVKKKQKHKLIDEDTCLFKKLRILILFLCICLDVLSVGATIWSMLRLDVFSLLGFLTVSVIFVWLTCVVNKTFARV